MIHAEANKSGMASSLYRGSESREGVSLFHFGDTRFARLPQINYELNATEAACDRKLSGPEASL